MLKKALITLGICASLSAVGSPASAQGLFQQLLPQIIQVQPQEQVQPQVQQAQLSCLAPALVRALQATLNLLNVTQAQQRAGLNGRVLSETLQLCQVNGVYAWVFSELGNDGTTRRRVVNALSGAIIPGV